MIRREPAILSQKLSELRLRASFFASVLGGKATTTNSNQRLKIAWHYSSTSFCSAQLLHAGRRSIDLVTAASAYTQPTTTTTQHASHTTQPISPHPIHLAPHSHLTPHTPHHIRRTTHSRATITPDTSSTNICIHPSFVDQVPRPILWAHPTCLCAIWAGWSCCATPSA